METLGKWLERHRKRLSLSQEELAQRAGCTRAYISALEREVIESKAGRPIQPSVEFIESLARALGAPISEAREVAGYKAISTAEDPQRKRLIAIFDEMSASKQSDLLAIAETLFRQAMSEGKTTDPSEITSSDVRLVAKKPRGKG